MKAIRIKDLEIVEQEEQLRQKPTKDMAGALSTLAVEKAKKDMAIGQMAQMVAQLSIQVQQLKGDTQ